MDFKQKPKVTPKTKDKPSNTDVVSEAKQFVNELCASCIHKNYCCLRKNKDQASYYCDEYEGIDIASAQPRQPQPEVEPKKVHEEFTGLCKNCEKRFKCSLSKSEGGVWHCEEYE